jgi:hypothetical protein
VPEVDIVHPDTIMSLQLGGGLEVQSLCIVDDHHTIIASGHRHDRLVFVANGLEIQASLRIRAFRRQSNSRWSMHWRCCRSVFGSHSGLPSMTTDSPRQRPKRGGLSHRPQIHAFLRRSGWTNLPQKRSGLPAVGHGHRCRFDRFLHTSPKLTQADGNSAVEGPAKLAEVDATAATFIASELAAVGTPLQVDGTIPETNVCDHPVAAISPQL